MYHCDIPCGIYDPHNAQMAAHTVIRMTQFLEEVKRDDETKAEHDIARITHVKEEHSNLIEDELMTLKNDYFKKEVVEKLGEEPWDLFKKALASSSKARQGIDMAAAKETLEAVMQIAELFYKSKGIESHRVKAPYPTGLDIVVQK
jgi:nickel superoxide dismutase